jgi:hypothetical protein
MAFGMIWTFSYLQGDADCLQRGAKLRGPDDISLSQDGDPQPAAACRLISPKKRPRVQECHLSTNPLEPMLAIADNRHEQSVAGLLTRVLNDKERYSPKTSE